MASNSEKNELLSVFPYLSVIQAKIIKVLKENGPLTRDQICEKFGFIKRQITHIDKYILREKKIRFEYTYKRYDKRSTIYDNLVKLQKRKFVEKFSRSNGKRGRPKVFFKLIEV